jgi:hypothetical protein
VRTDMMDVDRGQGVRVHVAVLETA